MLLYNTVNKLNIYNVIKMSREDDIIMN